MNKAPVAIIANEYATAAKISESVGLPVVASVGNDNLVDAAKEFRAANPDKPIIIAADRDAEIEARFAASAIGAAIVLPNVADKAMEKEVNCQVPPIRRLNLVPAIRRLDPLAQF